MRHGSSRLRGTYWQKGTSWGILRVLEGTLMHSSSTSDPRALQSRQPALLGLVCPTHTRTRRPDLGSFVAVSTLHHQAAQPACLQRCRSGSSRWPLSPLRPSKSRGDGSTRSLPAYSPPTCDVRQYHGSLPGSTRASMARGVQILGVLGDLLRVALVGEYLQAFKTARE